MPLSHRLYRIQKLLMKSIENSSPKSRETHERWDYRSGIIKSNQINDQHHQDKPAKEHIAESYGEIAIEIEDESEIQLTLGPTSYYRRKKLAETPRASDSGPSFSSSSTGSSNKEFLEIGRKKIFNVEEQLRHDHRVKQVAPNWLFKPLSLNMS
ncbi:uncharacterized protein LOC130774586 [Actinidia eriantha]|uniref:uncharacterized protein LOC130774586 n=1 Tax=Actinidia eriantha TaxID=165200 RepID=UPI00258BDB60|nr:uncharacterized protein LOC130774586 [Actinidia eriantha]